MANQTSDNNKRIAKNTMIYDKIINKLKGIQRMFAYNIKNILLNGIASSVLMFLSLSTVPLSIQLMKLVMTIKELG